MTAQGSALRSEWLRAPPQIRRAVFLTCYGTHFTEPSGEGWTPAEIKAMRAEKVLFRFHAFEGACADLDIEHRLTKPRHPWTNGQVERMNRTIKDATVKRFYYESHDQLRQHLADFVAAYNFARRLKTLRGLTPYEAICKAWTDEPSRFTQDPHHQIPGPNIYEPVRVTALDGDCCRSRKGASFGSSGSLCQLEEVVGGADHRPLTPNLIEAAQEELPKASGSLHLSEHRLDHLLSQSIAGCFGPPASASRPLRSSAASWSTCDARRRAPLRAAPAPAAGIL